jgi:hypothetical protein
VTDNTIRKKGVYIPPRKGKRLVHVICAKGGGQIGLVRMMRHLGPVLWFGGGIDAEGEPPANSLTLDEPEPGFEIWCPACGSHPLDMAALIAVSKRAAATGAPAEFFV